MINYILALDALYLLGFLFVVLTGLGERIFNKHPSKTSEVLVSAILWPFTVAWMWYLAMKAQYGRER